MKEVWKDIQEYEGLYQVSNLGRVRHLPYTIKWGGKLEHRPLKESNQHKSTGGYCIVVLSKNSKSKKFLVHRLVAKAFIPNPDNLPEVNHIDEDNTNNKVNNLGWCDRKYNVNYGTRTEKALKTRKENSKKHKTTVSKHNPNPKSKKIRKSKYDSVWIEERDIYGSQIGLYHGIKEAIKISGKSYNSIISNIEGRTKTSGGHVFVKLNKRLMKLYNLK